MRFKAFFALASLSALSIAVACGGSDDTTSKTGADAGSSSGTGTAGQPPDSPAGATPTPSTEARTFAITNFTLGDNDRSGNPNPDAWKTLGYDVDRLNTATEADLAKTCQGATKSVLDGENGIDNSFGHNIVPLISNVSGSPSKTLTEAALDGRFTLLIQVKGLTDDPAQTNTGLSGSVFFATPFGGDVDSGIRPTFTQSDDWPYRNDTQVDLASGYVVKSEFVNGAGTGEFPLALALAGSTVILTIHHGTITFTHDPVNQALIKGTIAGVVDTQKLVDSMDALASRLTPPICPGGALTLIKSAIQGSSDILGDGTQNPVTPCNGISIGIGFEAKRVGNPTKPVPPSAESQDNPCADGGQ